MGNRKKSRSEETNVYISHAYLDVAQKIVQLSNYGMPQVDFLQSILNMLLKSLDLDAVELRLKEHDRCLRSSAAHKPELNFQFKLLSCAQCSEAYDNPCVPDVLLKKSLDGITAKSEFCFFSEGKSFVSNNFNKLMNTYTHLKKQPFFNFLLSDGIYNSAAMVHMHIGSLHIGQISFWSAGRNHFTPNDVVNYEELGKIIGLALINQRTQSALRERVKELTCLYSINQIAVSSTEYLKELLGKLVELLPPAFQYPDIAAARIVFDKDSYLTPGFDVAKERIASNIVIGGNIRGEVSVCYTEIKPGVNENPFLEEEQKLIHAAAGEVALIIERKIAEENRIILEEQLRHADRLATIGQLVAGVTHEMNEPLGSILGFAQLMKKNSDLSVQSVKDAEKIETAALHAREVIRKLLIFSRQTMPAKTRVNLNQIVENGLYFLQSRCAKMDIQIELLLKDDLAEITADPSQLHQVLVNLIVNSIQAMPKGGKLTIKTSADGDYVTLIVKDIGIGMDEETQKRMFLPFFTTKKVGEGTGLGLSVVHGIVSSHNGKIEFESHLGRGTTFAVKLPIGTTQLDEESAKDDTIREQGEHTSR
ncbi:MAG: ATP-binding protein [Planctomycetota bacterium]